MFDFFMITTGNIKKTKVDKLEDSEIINCRCIEKSPSNSCAFRLVFQFQPPTVPDLDKRPKLGCSIYIWGEGPFSSRWFSLEIVAYAQSKVF